MVDHREFVLRGASRTRFEEPLLLGGARAAGASRLPTRARRHAGQRGSAQERAPVEARPRGLTAGRGTPARCDRVVEPDRYLTWCPPIRLLCRGITLVRKHATLSTLPVVSAGDLSISRSGASSSRIWTGADTDDTVGGGIPSVTGSYGRVNTTRDGYTLVACLRTPASAAAERQRLPSRRARGRSSRDPRTLRALRPGHARARRQRRRPRAALILYSARRSDAVQAEHEQSADRAALQRAARRAGRLCDPPPGAHVPARPRPLPAVIPRARAGSPPRSRSPRSRSRSSTTASRPSRRRTGRPRWSSTPTIHDGSFGTLSRGARRGADVGLAPSLHGARRARGRRLRAHLRKPRRRGRGDAAPSPRADLRLSVPASRARARARRRRAPRGLRAVRAARRASSRTAGGSCSRTTRSSATSPTRHAGPTKRT